MEKKPITLIQILTAKVERYKVKHPEAVEEFRQQQRKLNEQRKQKTNT